ncbi:hypothetical protein [Leclercia adecarboxylata]|uniref:hypothetical protein n=1 Tax=Leclercia adecarboxylata TaxID=83655 RepID=UPI00370C3DC7
MKRQSVDGITPKINNPVAKVLRTKSHYPIMRKRQLNETPTMKKLIIALTLVAAAPSANAAVDCVKPLSDYGYQLAEQYPVYRAYRGEFDKWLFAMCHTGEETRGIDQAAANAKMNMEAARYIRAYFNEVPEGAMRDGLTALLSLAGWSGYTGEAWPPAPTKAADNNAAAEKAAADKAAAAKAAAEKARN